MDSPLKVNLYKQMESYKYPSQTIMKCLVKTEPRNNQMPSSQKDILLHKTST